MQAETRLKNLCIKNIKKYYPSVWCVKINDNFTAGIPDLIMCINPSGRTVAIELKSKTGIVRPIQQYTINCINAAGGVARVCRSWDEVKKVLEEVIANVSSK